MSNTMNALLSHQDFQSQVKYTLKNLKPNHKILAEGQVHESLFLIKSGRVRVFISSASGEETPIHTGINELGPGHIFGEFQLFAPSPACADVITTTETELIEIDIPSLQKFLDSHVDIGYQLLNEILRTNIKRMLDSNKKILLLLEWGIQVYDIEKSSK